MGLLGWCWAEIIFHIIIKFRINQRNFFSGKGFKCWHICGTALILTCFSCAVSRAVGFKLRAESHPVHTCNEDAIYSRSCDMLEHPRIRMWSDQITGSAFRSGDGVNASCTTWWCLHTSLRQQVVACTLNNCLLTPIELKGPHCCFQLMLCKSIINNNK